MRHLIDIVASETWSDTEQNILNVCSAFVRRNCSTLVITRDARLIDTEFKANGISVEHAPLHGYFDLTSVLLLTRILKNTEGTVTVATHRLCDAFTALAARRLSHRSDVRIVYTRHGVRRGRNSAIMRRIYRNLSALIFVSDLSRQRFLSTWHNRTLPFPAENMATIHYSVPSGPTTPVPVPETGPLNVVFISRITYQCGLDTLIDALSLLKGERIRLKILVNGRSEIVDAMRMRADARGVGSMIDWKKNLTDIDNDIDSSLFAVFPANKEKSFGVSNLRVMSRGRTQICTAIGAVAEYLTDKLDFISVPPGNAGALAEAIRNLAFNRHICKEMGAAALNAYRQKYSWDDYMKNLTRTYFG